MLVLLLLIFMLVAVECMFIKIRCEPKEKYGGNITDLPKFRECYIEPIQKPKVDAFLSAHGSLRGYAFSVSDELASVEIEDKFSIDGYIEMGLNNEIENFAGISYDSGSKVCTIFFSNIKAVYALNSDAEYVRIKHNNEVRNNNKKHIPSFNTSSGNESVFILEEVSGNHIVIPTFIRDRTETPVPAVRLYNLTGVEDYFNATVYILFRIGEVSYCEHPDLEWLVYARDLCEEPASAYTETQRKAIQKQNVNDVFTNLNPTQGTYEKVSKVLPTLPSFAIEEYVSNGGSMESYLNTWDSPDNIIHRVLEVAEFERVFEQIETQRIERCSSCTYITKTETFKPYGSIVGATTITATGEYQAQDLFSSFVGIPHSDYSAPVLCPNCGVPTRRTNENIIANINTLKYIIVHIGHVSYAMSPKMRIKLRNMENIVLSSNRFEVIGVVCHQGPTYTNGHYTTYIKNLGSWYNLNDETCSIVTGDIYSKMDADDVVLFEFKATTGENKKIVSEEYEQEYIIKDNSLTNCLK